MRLAALLLCLVIVPNLLAGSLAVQQVSDSVFLSDPHHIGLPEFSSLVTYRNELYFTSSTTGDGTHRLFKTDGQSLVQFNVDPGYAGNTPFQEFEGQLYFRGDDGDGPELFRTDGNTLTKFDLSSAPYGSGPRNLMVFQNRLYFGATALNGAGEPRASLMSIDHSTVTWVADTEVKSSYPWAFPTGNNLYFTANGPDGFELYRTTGSDTRQIVDANPGPGGSDPSGGAVLHGDFYFNALGPDGRELYKTNGETAVKLPLRADPDRLGGPIALFPFGNHVYFFAKVDHGYELFRTDGTSVTEFDLNPGLAGSYPQTYGSNVLGDKLLIPASGPNGLALFVFDKAGEMTRRLDIYGNLFSQGALIFHEYKGEAYFEATGPDGPELYKTDGETLTQFDIVPDHSTGAWVQIWGAADFHGELYFSATTANGLELVKTDGTHFTTFDINPGLAGSSPRDLQVLGDELVFKADGTSGEAIYSTDGNVLRKLMELTPNYVTDDSRTRLWDSSSAFARLNDQLFFLANTPAGFRLQRIAAVPEPVSAVLLLLGGLGLLARRRLRRGRSIKLCRRD